MGGLNPEVTARHKKEFIENYLEGRYICAAARKTGVGITTVFGWRNNDPQFAALFDETRIRVEQMIVAKLEAEADRRAVTGTLKPVFYLGSKCGDVREYSDTLLIFRLKGLAPDKYRERLEHSGPGGGPILIKEVEVRLSGGEKTTG